MAEVMDLTEPPVRRTRLPREQRREQLLDIAERLFADRGFENTSVEDIARTAGVTRPVVYDHYATKEAIFIACVGRARAELEERMGDLEGLRGSGLTLDEVIEKGGEVFFTILERDPQRWSVLFGPSSALSAGATQELTDLRLGTVGRMIAVAKHFEPSVDEELVQAYAHAISGVGEQLGRWWLANPSVSLERVIGLHRDFIMRGLSPWADSVAGSRA